MCKAIMIDSGIIIDLIERMDFDEGALSKSEILEDIGQGKRMWLNLHVNGMWDFVIEMNSDNGVDVYTVSLNRDTVYTQYSGTYSPDLATGNTPARDLVADDWEKYELDEYNRRA